MHRSGESPEKCPGEIESSRASYLVVKLLLYPGLKSQSVLPVCLDNTLGVCVRTIGKSCHGSWQITTTHTRNVDGKTKTFILCIWTKCFGFPIHVTRLHSSDLSWLVKNFSYCTNAKSQSVVQTLWKDKLLKSNIPSEYHAVFKIEKIGIIPHENHFRL